MPEATSSKTTKAATKTAKEKPAKVDKEPRAPTPWMLFCQKNRAAWKQANPNAKGNEWMKALAEQWKDSPENPNRGKEPKSKKKSRTTLDVVAKDAASSSPPASSPRDELASSDF
ncbi:hypothetical protein K435DRAFT_784822 [Dendrothele bispora CBS 962.96]|uniref:HMG box domain-containing protein n=1 Tax=Dendrothele bispora (strain CBS 962.96) TaxID=1314807 RepID=A0A4S8L0M6_DENBC|nr:hypothetical protein K435DRAFT_784822 [Dendrothele bispora CBS 962.96]